LPCLLCFCFLFSYFCKGCASIFRFVGQRRPHGDMVKRIYCGDSPVLGITRLVCFWFVSSANQVGFVPLHPVCIEVITAYMGLIHPSLLGFPAYRAPRGPCIPSYCDDELVPISIRLTASPTCTSRPLTCSCSACSSHVDTPAGSHFVDSLAVVLLVFFRVCGNCVWAVCAGGRLWGCGVVALESSGRDSAKRDDPEVGPNQPRQLVGTQ